MLWKPDGLHIQNGADEADSLFVILPQVSLYGW